MTPDEHAAVIADEHTEHAREDIEARYVTRGACPDCEREGRSHRWMLANLPCREDDIADAYERLSAAVDPNPSAWARVFKCSSGPADPEVLAELVDALCPPVARDRRGRVVRVHRTSVRDNGDGNKTAPAGNRGLTTVPEYAETRLS